MTTVIGEGYIKKNNEWVYVWILGESSDGTYLVTDDEEWLNEDKGKKHWFVVRPDEIFIVKELE